MTDSPEHLADRPATPADLLRSPQEFADPPALEEAALGLDTDSQSHDLLSELLRSVRLSGERIVAYAPVRTFSIGFADVGSLHIIEEGELVLRIDGDPIRRRRHSAGRSRTATARHRLAGDETHERSTHESSLRPYRLGASQNF